MRISVCSVAIQAASVSSLHPHLQEQAEHSDRLRCPGLFAVMFKIRTSERNFKYFLASVRLPDGCLQNVCRLNMPSNMPLNICSRIGLLSHEGTVNFVLEQSLCQRVFGIRNAANRF